MRTMMIAGAMALCVISCNNASQNESEMPDNAIAPAVDGSGASGTYMADAEKSVITWKGGMVGMYAHEGTIKPVSGSLTVTNGVISGGDFTVDLHTIVTTDSDDLYKMASREKLIGHLQSDDFFGVEKFPTAGFTIKSVEGDKVTGDLSIKGVTHEETITSVALTASAEGVEAGGKLVFDRQKYGVSYKSQMKDMVLSDEIELTISLIGRP